MGVACYNNTEVNRPPEAVSDWKQQLCRHNRMHIQVATVIGGIKALCEVFKKASEYNTQVFVHCWGGPVCMAANYHSALAFKGEMAEWPMPYYPLREEMMIEPWSINKGRLTIPKIPGLGIRLSSEIEEKYQFRETAIYSCISRETELSPDEQWYS